MIFWLLALFFGAFTLIYLCQTYHPGSKQVMPAILTGSLINYFFEVIKSHQLLLKDFLSHENSFHYTHYCLCTL